MFHAPGDESRARLVSGHDPFRRSRRPGGHFLEAAKIAVATAELNVARHKQLAEQGLVSQRELELTIQSAIASKADLQGAQANLKAAEQAMKALSFGHLSRAMPVKFAQLATTKA